MPTVHTHTRWRPLIVTAALLFAAAACSEVITSPGPGVQGDDDTPPTLTEQAIEVLEVALFAVLNNLDDVADLDALSFEPARALFEQAVAEDPANEVAAFGLAMTTVFVLEDNPELRAIAEEWETWLETHSLDDLTGHAMLAAATPFFWGRASLPLDLSGISLRRATRVSDLPGTLLPTAATHGAYPPSPEDHQDLLRDEIVPVLLEALGVLNTVDSPGFVFLLTERMQGENPGEADTLELDLTEVYALRAALEVALATSDVALAYVLAPSPYGADGFAAALQPGSTFGTLQSTGGTLLADAHQRLLRTLDLLNDGLDFLEDETDDQSNDIIKRDPNDGISAQDIQDARDVLADIEGALEGPYDVTEDFGHGEVTVRVDVSRFFLDPITDLKALLPTYEVVEGTFRWRALMFDDWTLPDPSFNGIFPNMTTTSDVTDAFDISSVFWEIGTPLTGYYRLLTIDDVECGTQQMGCQLATANVLNAYLDFYEWAYLSIETAEDTNLDGFPDVFDYTFYWGPYTASYQSPTVIDVVLTLEDDLGTPVTITATMTDVRSGNGGFPITFTHLGGDWVFEKDDP
jgi:hypothetical protein